MATRTEVRNRKISRNGSKAPPGRARVGPAVFLLVDRDDLEALIVVLRVGADDLGHLLAAGLAPRRPEVEQYGLALQVAQPHRLAVQGGEPEVGRRAPLLGHGGLAGVIT